MAEVSSWNLTLELRSWQQRALEEWSRGLSGIVSVVTGGGKTIFAAACISQYRKRFPNGKVLVVVPTVALADQWYVSLSDDLHVPSHEIAVHPGADGGESDPTITIMVLNSARNKAEAMSDKYPLFLVVDECHRAASPENAKALRGPHVATLGLSATPEREYDDGLDAVLIPALGKVIYEYSYQDARADGVITRFDLINVRVDMLRHEQEEYDRLTQKITKVMAMRSPESPEILKQLLQKRAAVSASATMRLPVAVKLVEQHKAARTIVFHERVDAVDTLVSNMVQRGIHAAAYHTKISPELRRDNLKLFRRGIMDVLVTCRALDEGFNVPEASVAVVASSTASQRQRIQRLGRVLRPFPGKEFARIYTIYATDAEEKRLAEECEELGDIATTSWLRSSIRHDTSGASTS